MEKFPGFGSNLGKKVDKLKRNALLVGALAMPPVPGAQPMPKDPTPAVAEALEPQRQAPQKPEKKEYFPQNQTVEYPAREIAGLRLPGEFSLYTGIVGRVGATVKINFTRQLQHMWDLKIKKYPDNIVFQEVARILINEYKSRPVEHTTFDIEIERMDKIVNEIKNAQGIWEKVAQIKHLTPPEAALVKDIFISINGKDMGAYMLTEIAPADGVKNIKVVNFIFRNGGREFINDIAAGGDDKTSFGRFQMTEFTVFDTPKEKRGASIINPALPPNLRIPGSVAMLRGDDHTRAAFLLAINNVSDLVKMSSHIGKMDVLKNASRQRHGELVQIIATMHHGQGAVIYGVPETKHRKKHDGMAKLWLLNDAKKDFIGSTWGEYTDYARKTKSNYDAIYNRAHHAVLAPKAPSKLETLHPNKKPEVKKTEPQSKTLSHPKVSAKGSKAAMEEQFQKSKQEHYNRLQNTAQVNEFVAKGWLVPILGNENYRIDKQVEFPYARQEVRLLIEKFSQQYREACGEQMVVTSLERPLDHQPKNASPISVHPAGMSVDFRISKNPNCRQFFLKTVLSLESKKLVQFTKEGHPPHYHVAVYKAYEDYVHKK